MILELKCFLNCHIFQYLFLKIFQNKSSPKNPPTDWSAVFMAIAAFRDILKWFLHHSVKKKVQNIISFG